MKKLFVDFKQDKYKVLTFFILVFLVIFSPLALNPKIAGDSLLYTSSIDVLKTGILPAGFMPMMILTTYLGLRLIMFFDLFINNIAISWLVLDSILYVTMGLFFYSLVKRMFDSSKTAFVGTLFLVTNYAAISFGLGYLMDMGGWTAYVASLFFSWRYLESYCKEDKWLYISSTIIGVGGLYKEYAFVAYVIVFGVVVWGNWGKWFEILKKLFVTGVLAFTPFILMNIYTFVYYGGYTYIDWMNFQKVYVYQDRVVEFIKSFGSIYNFGWFLFIPGFYILLKRYKDFIKDKRMFFICFCLISCLSVLLWPVVTRVLFITIPAIVLVSALFIQKTEKKVYLIWSILLAYVFCAYLMDAYILDNVDISSILKFLHI
jgi:hypothetical protein